MSAFWIHFQLGFSHLTDLNGYDHMLFLAALCALYTLKDWRKVAILATAFTVGHSLTLALSAWGAVDIDPGLIEVLIPATILMAAVANVWEARRPDWDGVQYDPKRDIWKGVHGIGYGIALSFGLIHGLGFSNFFRALMGSEGDILGPLFSFNLGLEVGQLLVVAVLLGMSWLVTKGLGLPRRYWNIGLSALAGAVSMVMIFQRL